MTIRNIQETDYEELIELFKNFFKTHNIFQQTDQDIVNYLKDQSKKNELIIYDDNGSLKGALYLVHFGQNTDGSHKLWKFRHFAFENENVASELLKEAERRIKENSQTSKIELTIAENEKGVNVYKANSYEQEGNLTNHYRWGEVCFIFSKSFS